jgi:YfiH family protein
VFLNFADCTPLIFYDEKQNIGAVAHAGWRGTVAKIGVLTAEKMINEFNSKLQNIKVIIGPAISLCCYNVGEDVFYQLRHTVNKFENLYEIRTGNIYVDLKNINKTQLTEFGIGKIDVCPYCTCCNNDLFFSYRKENGTTNRHSAVLKIV